MGARVLLVGNGAREHAIAWKLRQSPQVEELFVAPGNAGTATLATNIPVQPKDIDGLVDAAHANRVDFYLATMDDPQPLGLVDRLTEAGVQLRTGAAAARIEASKAWSKEFMVRNGIRTPTAQTFTRYDEAAAYVRSLGDRPVVVKASGLAAGKGAIVCNGESEALEALDIAMLRRDFGSAGDTVLVEERLYGWEASAHAFCDGKTIRMMPFATDYKRAGDGDIGLNTGGMGAYSPSAQVDETLAGSIREEVVERTIAAMRTEGTPFSGTLFPGLMVTESGVHVIEFNARFGDPETQVLMPRLETDLFEIAHAAAEQRLDKIEIRWSPEAATVGVVMASGGYPATYKMSYPIEGMDAVDPGVLVFQAGTKADPRGIVTNGGRVLTVVATGDTVATARALAYENVKRISFADMQFRRDIAADVE